MYNVIIFADMISFQKEVSFQRTLFLESLKKIGIIQLYHPTEDVCIDDTDIVIFYFIRPSNHESCFEILSSFLHSSKYCFFYMEDIYHISAIKRLLKKYETKLYIAYNHRFEPNLIRLKKYLDKKIIGKIYSVEMYYGNGTSKLWSNSIWRQKDNKGVVIDLAPHLLDTYIYLFGNLPAKGDFFLNNNFENTNMDFAKFGFKKNDICITLTTSLIDWKNNFEINIIGNKGSLHVKNLCKWDDSYLIYRKRILPSGKPNEKVFIEKMGDPTWKLEHNYFFRKLKKRRTNLNNDIIIKKFIDELFA